MNSKDINDPIINMILAEGKWDVANVRIATDDEIYISKLYEQIDEELTSTLSRLDESISNDDVAEELVESLEEIAESKELTKDQIVYAKVVSDRLDELFGGRLTNFLRGKGFKTHKELGRPDNHKLLTRRIQDDPEAAARYGLPSRGKPRDPARAAKVAAVRLARRKQAAVDRIRARGGNFAKAADDMDKSGYTTRGLQGYLKGELPAPVKGKKAGMLDAARQAGNSRRAELGIMPVLRAEKAQTSKPKSKAKSSEAPAATPNAPAQASTAQASTAQAASKTSGKVKKATGSAKGSGKKKTKSNVASSSSAPATKKPVQGELFVFGKPKKGESNNAGLGHRVPNPSVVAANKDATARAKARAKGGKKAGAKAEQQVGHTVYEGDGITLAESIIYNVKNRLL